MSRIKTYKNIQDSYKFYKSKEKKVVKQADYKRIAANFNLFLVSKILKGEIVSLPAGLGTLGITGKKIVPKFNAEGQVENLAIDWKRTTEMWAKRPETKKRKQKVYYTNDHSDGYRYKYRWSKDRVNVPGKSAYYLIMSRTNKRAAAKRIKEGGYFLTLD